MYKQGELKIHHSCAPPERCTWFEVDAGHTCWLSDSRDDSTADVLPGTVYLPHSCGEWVIGGREQVEALIADLQRSLQTVEASNSQDSK